MPPIENRAHIQEGSPSSHWGWFPKQLSFPPTHLLKKLGLKPTYLKKGFFLLNYIGSFQEGGDVLIMAGCFQQEFQHGVPSRKNWERLRDQIGRNWTDWELQGLAKEMELHRKQEGPGPDKRLNCTLRWNAKRKSNCPWYHESEDPSQRLFRAMKRLFRGIKRAESSGDESWKIMAEVMKTCWPHSSVNNELDLLKSWSIGGTHVARSPIEALRDVFKAVQDKQEEMSQVSDALQENGTRRLWTRLLLVPFGCPGMHAPPQCVYMPGCVESSWWQEQLFYLLCWLICPEPFARCQRWA